MNSKQRYRARQRAKKLVTPDGQVMGYWRKDYRHQVTVYRRLEEVTPWIAVTLRGQRMMSGVRGT